MAEKSRITSVIYAGPSLKGYGDDMPRAGIRLIDRVAGPDGETIEIEWGPYSSRKIWHRTEFGRFLISHSYADIE